ncbi:MAG: aspartate-semialdehyde dehydrogenase [Candidatus Eremiobacteraeota bacterium]|nr:aspartate-semialdehyde dehydrogenase [Candidatus Eremiobacteraeota bacterium]
MESHAGIELAIVGATGAVGETLLRVLAEREVPLAELHAFASRERAVPLSFRGRPVAVRAATKEALRGHDVVIFASDEQVSKAFVPACIECGATVIDNSPLYRLAVDVPLVVPEINGDLVQLGQHLFPVGNCTAIILTMALWPIARTAGLRSVRVASYQAVSGAGKPGLEELASAERALHDGTAEPDPHAFPARIARNVIPQIGSLDDAGDSTEERKVAAETRKILGLPELRVAVTTVRVPVKSAHSAAVFLETDEDVSVVALASALRASPGIAYHDRGIVTPRDVEGHDDVHVARLRAESGSKRFFQLWAVGDQLRKGAATTAVQILELLIARGLREKARLLRA